MDATVSTKDMFQWEEDHRREHEKTAEDEVMHLMRV